MTPCLNLFPIRNTYPKHWHLRTYVRFFISVVSILCLILLFYYYLNWLRTIAHFCQAHSHIVYMMLHVYIVSIFGSLEFFVSVSLICLCACICGCWWGGCVFVCLYVYEMYWGHMGLHWSVEVRGPLCGVGSLLLPLCGSHASNIGCQACLTSPITQSQWLAYFSFLFVWKEVQQHPSFRV